MEIQAFGSWFTMGLDNPIHIAFLVVILLLVFGAKRLPEMGKSLGGGMRGFKESLGGEQTPASLTAQSHAPAAPVPAVAVNVPVANPLGESHASTV
jgi:sec-independent protein translocase protein TatA